MKSYLFIGTEDFKWGPSNYDGPIALCKKYGITGLLVKAYEITQGLWYGGITGFDAIYQHITGARLECIPYGFLYGGVGLPAEAAVGLLFMDKYGVFCMDSESAFDGHTDWGQKLATIWNGHPGRLWISTWANPADHNQLGFIDALKPHVQAWMPQVYSDKLAPMALAQWPHGLPMQPTVGIVGDGDPNTGANHVHLFGSTDISIWEYEEGVAHGDRLGAIMTAAGVQTAPAPPQVIHAPFPMVSERTPVTGDSHPSENAGLNCVAASILAGVMWLLRKTQLDSTFNPDALKDAVYGQGYVGGMAASAFVSYLAKQFGITLASFKGTSAQLVQRTHTELKAGHPVVMTIANPYGNPVYTHVCVFHPPEKPGELTVMDPWPPKDITRADARWEALLLDNEIWIMSKIGEDMVPLTLNDVKQYFTPNPDSSWTRLDKAGKVVVDSAGSPVILKGAIKDDWCNHGLAAIPDIGLPTGNETQVDPANHPEIVDQEFERCKRRFDPHHVKDSPAHAGVVYSPHIENLYGAQDKLNMALDQLATAEKQLAAGAAPGAPASGAAASPESAYMAAVKSIKSIVDPLAV